jgi:polysaccharide pyruvyl transferase WcaK-like protein
MAKLYYLVAPTGVPNFGDELIAATWLRYLAGHDPDAEVVLDCLNPIGVTAGLFRINPRLRTTTVLWQLCFRNWAAGADAAERVAAIVADPDRAPVPVHDLAEGLDLLRRADIVHLLGGGFLNDIWPGFLGLLGGITAATAGSGGVAAMTGQGLCPPAAAGARVRALLDGFTVVDVRDSPSTSVAGETATCSGDDAFLGLSTPPPPVADFPDLMVSVQSQLSGVATEELVELVTKTAVEWRAASVGLLECAPEEDREMLDALVAALPSARRYSVHDVLDHGLPAAPGQCWLSTRFHPHLYAAAAGASGVAININGDYYGTKHRSLTERGSRWTVLDRPAVPARPVSGGFTPEELATLHAGKLAVAQRIYA